MLLCGPWEQDLLLGNPRWENFTHKNWRKQSCMGTGMLNSRVSYILRGVCPAQVASPLKSGFYCRRTTRHLLRVMTTLHIGAGRKWRVNERNNFSHMAKVLLHFNCAAERSRLDLCRWRDNLLLWFLNVPLQNWRSRNWGINKNFPVQAVASDLLLKQLSRGILKLYWLIPHFQGDHAVFKAGLEHIQVEKDAMPKCPGCHLWQGESVCTDLTLKRVCRLPALQRCSVRREVNRVRGSSVPHHAPSSTVRWEGVLSLCQDTSHPLPINWFLTAGSPLTLSDTANTILWSLKRSCIQAIRISFLLPSFSAHVTWSWHSCK